MVCSKKALMILSLTTRMDYQCSQGPEALVLPALPKEKEWFPGALPLIAVIRWGEGRRILHSIGAICRARSRSVLIVNHC